MNIYPLSAYNFTLLDVILSLQNDLQRCYIVYRVTLFIADMQINHRLILSYRR